MERTLGERRKPWYRGGWFLAVLLAILVGAMYYTRPEVRSFARRPFQPSNPVESAQQGPVTGPQSAASAPTPANIPAAQAMATGLSTVADTVKPPPVRTYKVRPGDTLSGVFGREDGKKVCELNKLVNCDKVLKGKVLHLPDGVTAKAVKPTVKRGTSQIARTREQSCIKLGAHPFNPDFDLGRTLQGIDLLTTLTPEQKAKAKELVSSGLKPQPTLVAQHIFREMIFEKNKKVVHVYEKRICSPAEGNVPEVMYLYGLGGGVNFALPRRCGNPAVVIIPEVPVETPPVVPVEAPPVVQQPEPIVPLPPLSVIPKAVEVAEWEAIVGAGVWDNKLAHGNWQYAEGMISKILPDGYRVGVGLYGQWGAGESETSSFAWKEKAYGPQVGVKRNFLVTQTDQFGQQTLMPAGWGVKFRFLKDSVSGSNPQSGFSTSQTGRKVGLYAEYMERKSPDWMVGINGEIWNFGSGKLTSSFAGDTVQDRGSWNLNAWAQYRHSDDWQTRGIAGVAHQNWDQLNLFRVAGELRYKETFMCGPSVSFALNKPAIYSGVNKSDLTTLGFGCRAEFGGIIRTWDREQREAGVTYVGPAQSPPE